MREESKAKSEEQKYVYTNNIFAFFLLQSLKIQALIKTFLLFFIFFFLLFEPMVEKERQQKQIPQHGTQSARAGNCLDKGYSMGNDTSVMISKKANEFLPCISSQTVSFQP